MKTQFLISMIALLLIGCFPQKQPKIQTYSIKGDVVFVNECSDYQPKEIEIVARLWYKRIGVFPDVTKRQKFKFKNGVAKFQFKDVPTNMTARKWTLEFPNLCANAKCEIGTCQNTATNVRQPIKVRSATTTYNYRYSCTCLR